MSNVTTYSHAWALMRNDTNYQLLSFSGSTELVVLKRLRINPILHDIPINILYTLIF